MVLFIYNHVKKDLENFSIINEVKNQIQIQ